MLITLPNTANFSYMVNFAETMVMRQLQLHLELVKSTDVSQTDLRLVQHREGTKLDDVILLARNAPKGSLPTHQ